MRSSSSSARLQSVQNAELASNLAYYPMGTTGFSIATTTKDILPAIPFKKIKDDILGHQYVVSLVFVGEKRAASINKQWRKKTYTPNVLAFEVAPECGEIYITPKIAAKECAEYDHTLRQHLAFLFIHALLHLEGHAHGDTMERSETAYMKKYRFL